MSRGRATRAKGADRAPATRAKGADGAPSRGADGARATLLAYGDLELLVIDLPDEAPLPAALTPSEREVVAEMIEGASNAAIAAARGTSVRTVANQLKSAYRKLGVFSRAELVAALGRGSEGAPARVRASRRSPR